MVLNSPDSDELGRTWDEHPEVIRAFIEIRPQYEQLCNEVAYILTKRMDETGIEYSAVTYRAKTLKSFAEKLSRKQYNEPFKNITDLAGVRLVYLYKSDRVRIEGIIESEFKVEEKIDKVEEQDEDRFGYGAIHYFVHLGRKSSGARYDDLKSLICEIQVRTVLQDAWAIIDHHLVYKHESDVPKPLKRKLNSVAGLFETADDQFDRIRAERQQYRESIKSKLSSKEPFLDQDLNLDTFVEYLKWKFPSLQLGRYDDHISQVLTSTVQYGYNNLAELDSLLNRTQDMRSALSKDIPTTSAASEVARAIAFEQPEYCEARSEGIRSVIEKYLRKISTRPS